MVHDHGNTLPEPPDGGRSLDRAAVVRQIQEWGRRNFATDTRLLLGLGLGILIALGLIALGGSARRHGFGLLIPLAAMLVLLSIPVRWRRRSPLTLAIVEMSTGDTWRLIEELPHPFALGPNGGEVVALLARLPSLTGAQWAAIRAAGDLGGRSFVQLWWLHARYYPLLDRVRETLVAHPDRQRAYDEAVAALRWLARSDVLAPLAAHEEVRRVVESACLGLICRDVLGVRDFQALYAPFQRAVAP